MSRERIQGQGGLVIDIPLLLIVFAIAAVGLLNLRSAAEVDGVAHHLTQLLWMGLGLVGATAIASQDYRIAERGAWVFYGVVVLLLGATLVIGTELNNSRRWIDLGVFMLQPSEITKLATIIVTARWFADHERPDGHSLMDLIPPLGLVLVPFTLILMQPDLGTGLTILLIFATMVAFERVRWTAYAVMAGAAAIIAPLMWAFVLLPYQKRRIMTFLNPGENLQGDAWQVSQARIAIGSGRWFGKGYLQGTQVQNGFVPEHENDFIFTHHGEQFGFIGSLVLIGLFAALILWALRIARHGRDRFAVLTAVGIAAFIFWHVVINLGMVTGALPVVGLWLPMVSYGGNAMLTTLFTLGLLMSISMRRYGFAGGSSRRSRGGSDLL